MFSPDIVESDAFLEMPLSTQALYFHLGMRADDDGFVNPRVTMRSAGAMEDDLKLLFAKRFAIPFENGIIVIKHWRVNNLIRKDWYRETQYLEEKSKLFIKKNQVYTLDSDQGEPVHNLVNENVTGRQRRLGKDRLGKDSNIAFDKFWKLYPRKVAKKKAEQAWDKIPASEHEAIYADIAKRIFSESWKDQGGKFIPHPTTYLNQERWKDRLELPQPVAMQKKCRQCGRNANSSWAQVKGGVLCGDCFGAENENPAGRKKLEEMKAGAFKSMPGAPTKS